MNFLEKLDYLMVKNNLNKSTLSKACDIPYTTIDGWYKKGYEGLKLTTLRKLANYFSTSLDFWANDNIQPNVLQTDEKKPIFENEKKQKEFFDAFEELSPVSQDFIIKIAEILLETQSKIQSPNEKN